MLSEPNFLLAEKRTVADHHQAVTVRSSENLPAVGGGSPLQGNRVELLLPAPAFGEHLFVEGVQPGLYPFGKGTVDGWGSGLPFSASALDWVGVGVTAGIGGWGNCVVLGS